MIATAVNGRALGLGARGKQVSFVRLLWVTPLTVVVSLALNFAIKLVVQALDPTDLDPSGFVVSRPLGVQVTGFASAGNDELHPVTVAAERQRKQRIGSTRAARARPAEHFARHDRDSLRLYLGQVVRGAPPERRGQSRGRDRCTARAARPRH